MNTNLPTPRLAPLPEDHSPALADAFATVAGILGFVPNSFRIMQRRPILVETFARLVAAVWVRDAKVDHEFKRLVGIVASRAAGCQYCMAHNASVALALGIDADKLESVWNFESSPLFTPAERVALEVAFAAGSVPNGVTDEMFDRMKAYWSEEQIVEIVGVIALFGFMNRFNDTMATPLEAGPLAAAEKHLAAGGWRIGRHARAGP